MNKNLLLTLLICSLTLLSCVQTEAVKPANQSGETVSETCDISSVSETLKDPKSNQDLINLINALPKPLTAECLLKSLKRPLYVSATASTLSAQPASSWSSPRVFIVKNNLYIALVPTGVGSNLLEFSELVSTIKSIKGEIVLPIENDLSQSDPYSHINYSNRTTCSGCHGSEELVKYVGGVPVYSSLAFRPRPADDVPVSYLRDSHYLCQSQFNTSQRCNFLKALFAYGDVIEKPFPETMPLPDNTFGL